MRCQCTHVPSQDSKPASYQTPTTSLFAPWGILPSASRGTDEEEAALAGQNPLEERYRRLKKSRGNKRAALTIGHPILAIYYQMTKTGEECHEKGVEYQLQDISI